MQYMLSIIFPCDLPAAAADVEMRFGCLSSTGSDHLAEPEFAGLWDKRAAVKPPGGPAATADKTPRTKSCNRSKMEKVNLSALYPLSVDMF